MKILKSDERGQALVELALVLTVLMMILLGIVEFARIGHAYLVATHASREAARLGALNYPDNQLADRVWEVAASLDSEALEVVITPIYGQRQRGDSVEVAVFYEVTLISPLSAFLPDPFPIRAQTIMRVE